MLIPEIKYIICPELHENGENGLPNDIFDAWLHVQVNIGLKNQDSSSIFTFYVCTLQKIESVVKEDGHLLGKNLIIVEYVDWDKIENIIDQIVSNAKGESWSTIVDVLSKYSAYEFDNYIE